ncbi:MAG: hypothetical protein ACI906_003200 [Candidatus Latescibacterota bacterium]|jgi:hypothetical protein
MKRIVCATLLLAAMAMPAWAQYSVTRSVFGNGSARISSGNTLVRGTVGQAAIGVLNELSGQQQQVGFWYVLGDETEPINDAGQYALLGSNSIYLKNDSEVHTGFVGVNEIGLQGGLFLHGKVELSIGTQVQTGPEVELSAARVAVKNKAQVAGVVHYLSELDAHKKATVAESIEEDADFWSLVDLPDFKSATVGDVDIQVTGKEQITLAPEDGPFATIKIKSRGMLIFSGGEYHIENLDVGSKATVVFEAPTTLLIANKLSTAASSSFGPGADSGISAADILVYVEGYNGRVVKEKKEKSKKNEKDEEEDDDQALAAERFKSNPKAVTVGEQAVFQASVYAPNGTVLLKGKIEATGGFIARDVEVGEKTKVFLDSGWENGTGIVGPPAPVAKAVARAALAQVALPDGFGLDQNYPNPFNPSTAIRYALVEMSDVKLSIYNMLGQEIRVLVRDARPAGIHTVEWDGRDAMGRHVAAGLYFYRIEAGQFRATRKMLMIK